MNNFKTNLSKTVGKVASILNENADKVSKKAQVYGDEAAKFINEQAGKVANYIDNSMQLYHTQEELDTANKIINTMFLELGKAHFYGHTSSDEFTIEELVTDLKTTIEYRDELQAKYNELTKPLDENEEFTESTDDTSTPEKVFCSNCGTEHNSNKNYCSKCGNALDK